MSYGHPWHSGTFVDTSAGYFIQCVTSFKACQIPFATHLLYATYKPRTNLFGTVPVTQPWMKDKFVHQKVLNLSSFLKFTKSLFSRGFFNIRGFFIFPPNLLLNPVLHWRKSCLPDLKKVAKKYVSLPVRNRLKSEWAWRRFFQKTLRNGRISKVGEAN